MSSRISTLQPPAFRFTSLMQLPLVQAMSGRRKEAPAEGDLGYTPHNDHAVIDDNRDAFLRAVGIDPLALTLGRQVHGTTVARVGSADRGRGRPPRFDGFPATDALVTDACDVALGTVVADCVPLLVYDTRRHVLGVAHAGWRGTVGLIARHVVIALQANFGSRPADLVAGIGPSIGPCCYEVGAEVLEAWGASGVSHPETAVARCGEAYHFDLWTANHMQLVEAGLPSSQIEVSQICTRCESERFFSYRGARAGLGTAGRMMMVAQLGVPG